MISQILFFDITNSIFFFFFFWYHKIVLGISLNHRDFWYHKIDFVISMNRISDIKKSILWYHKSDDVWYHKFYFVISQIPTIFLYQKIDFVISQTRFGNRYFSSWKKNARSRNIHKHAHFHSYRREKLIKEIELCTLARAFAVRINGTQIAIRTSTSD